MLSKAEAMEMARRLPGPPQRLLRFRCFEVMVAWLELHDLDIALTPLGKARWESGALVVGKVKTPVPVVRLPLPDVFVEDDDVG